MKKMPLLLLLFFSTALLAQKEGVAQIKILKDKLSLAKNQSEKINISLELSTLYLHYNLDSCYVFAQNALTLSNQTKQPESQAQSYSAMAKYFTEKNNLDEAIRQNNKSLSINKRVKNQKGIAYNYLIFGRVHQVKADYVKASQYYFPALKITEKEKDEYTQLMIYKNLAFLFLDQGDNKKALDYAFKANKIANKKNYPEEIGFCAGIVAEVYRLSEKQKEAEIWFKKGYDYFEKHDNDYGKAWIFTNWSIVFDKDLIESLEMELKAQEIWDRISPDNIMSIANLYNIGYSYLYVYDRRGDPDPLYRKLNLSLPETLNKAKEYLLRSKALARKNNNAQWVMNSYYGLSAIYVFARDFENYTDSVKAYYWMKDSLYSQEHKNAIAAMESQQKLEAKDKEIQLNKLTLEAKEKEKWFYILGIVSLIAIGGLILWQSQNRKKTNEKLQLLNAELDEANKVKTRFFSILNHDLRSPVSSLISFLHLQKDSPELLDAESKARMESKTISSAENLLESMEDILLWSKGQMENFSPQPKKIAVASVFEDIQKHFSNVEQVNLVFKNPENISLFTDENYLKTILRNLVSNAIKALDKTPNATVILSAGIQNGKPMISVSDNGPGGTIEQFKALYDEKEVVGIKTGLGLHLIRDLAKAINCHIAVDTKLNEGTLFTISFEYNL